MSSDKPWKQVKADWRDVVLVCRKCAKKLDGGFGDDGDEGFAKALRRSIDAGEGRKPKMRRRKLAVVEVGCLDICPRRAVVVVRGSDPQSIIMIPKGADMAEVKARLGLQADGTMIEIAAAPS